MRTVAAVLCAAVAVCPVAAACSSGGDGARPGEPTTTTIRRTTAAEVPLAVGQCGNVPGIAVGGAVDPAAITTVPCDEPHDVEVAVVFEFPASTAVPFPGTDAVDGYATDECLERFEGYVGIPFEASRLDVLIVAPDRAGWAAGDRRVACVVYDTDFADLTGSVEDAGI